MKTKFCVWVLLLAATLVNAQTNSLTSLLQHGLFEEQANRNLDAAITDYQSLITRFDKDRQLAATAIFRLGECYRLQGKTNEAAVQYQRILREFADQKRLATLSRRDLAGLGISMAVAQSSNAVVSAPNNAEDQEIQRIQQMIKNSPDLINAPGPGGFTPLQTAAQRGQLLVARFLLSHGADVNRGSANNSPPLFLAAINGHNAMVMLLLKHGANVDIRNGAGWTPLYDVAGRGYAIVAKTLIEHKADVNARANDGRTPLYQAASTGHLALVDLLLAHGAKVNVADSQGRTALMLAVMKPDHAAVVKALLAAKANTSLQAKQGRTALSYAVQKSDAESVRELLAAHADPNGGERDMPLAMAVSSENTNVAALLLRAGADPNREATFDGSALRFYGQTFQRGVKCTPLQVLVGIYSTANKRTSLAEMARLLFRFKANPRATLPFSDQPLVWQAYWDADLLKAFLAAGANPNAGNEHGLSILDMAASYGKAASVKVLLKAGARVNPPADAQQIPLFLAIQNGNLDTIRLLLDAGAKVNRRDQQGTGNTPLLMAVQHKQIKAAALLLAHGANPNLATSDGNTPLYFAVAEQNRDLVQLLLTNKAKVNIRNKNGETPLDWAKAKLKHPGPHVIQVTPVRRPGQTAELASPASLVALLRQHGALDHLPDWDRIEVSRPSTHYSATIFRKSTNDWNQFTLFGLLGVQYKLLNASTKGQLRRVEDIQYTRSAHDNHLAYPDFTRIVIHRPSPGGTNWSDLKVNLAGALDSGDCSANVPLHFGDVVEIPEADHVMNERWPGLTTKELFTLKKCLTRHVQITVKGHTTTLTLQPQVEKGRPGSIGFINVDVEPSASQTLRNASAQFTPQINVLEFEPFMLWPVLEHSKLLLSSSDLAHIHVQRRDPATGKLREWTVDCSHPNSPPDFWLRDGDRIEVPEK